MTMRGIARAAWCQDAKLARALIDKSTLGAKYLQMNATPASPRHCSVAARKDPALFATDAAAYHAAASDERRAQAAAAARQAFQEQRQLRGDRWGKRANTERGKGELSKPCFQAPGACWYPSDPLSAQRAAQGPNGHALRDASSLDADLHRQARRHQRHIFLPSL
eukprot:2604987-Pyramimonas_sp.AAC.1